MTKDDIDKKGDDMMIDVPEEITNPIENPDEFNLHYLRIYYGKFSLSSVTFWWLLSSSLMSWLK